MDNKNKSVVENMLNVFAKNGNLVSEPYFFGTPLSEYFSELERNPSFKPAPTQAFQAGRQIAKETIARFKELNVFQNDPMFFGVPVEEYLSQLEETIWDQILQDVADYKPVYDMS